MSEFPQNRRFSVAEEVAAAAQRFCLRKEAYEEEMHVDDDVGPRADAHARSTIALLMRVIMKFCLSRMSRMCRTQIRKKTQKYEHRIGKKDELLISITTTFERARAVTTRGNLSIYWGR